MKVFVSSVVALSFLSATAAFAHTRAPSQTGASSAAFVSDQMRQPSSRSEPLANLKDEDVSHALYWTTPTFLGGGLDARRDAVAR